MAGTPSGGRRAAQKNQESDPDFYQKIGRKGGQSGRTGGFASKVKGKDGLTGPERARLVGPIGGRKGKPPPQAKVLKVNVKEE